MTERVFDTSIHNVKNRKLKVIFQFKPMAESAENNIDITKHETRLFVKHIVNNSKPGFSLMSGGPGGDYWNPEDYEEDELCHVLYVAPFQKVNKPDFIKGHFDITVKRINDSQRLITIECVDKLYIRYTLSYQKSSSTPAFKYDKYEQRYEQQSDYSDENNSDSSDDEFEDNYVRERHVIDKDASIDTNYQFSISNLKFLCDDDIYRENGWSERDIEKMHTPLISAYITQQYEPLNERNGYYTMETFKKCVYIDYDRIVPDNLFRLYWSPTQTFARNTASCCEPIEIRIIKAVEQKFLNMGYTLPEVEAYDKSKDVKCYYIEVLKQRVRGFEFKWELMVDLVYDAGVRIKVHISQSKRASDIIYPPTEDEDDDLTVDCI